MSQAAEEIERGERFGFGKNWQRFLETVDEDRVAEATRSLREALSVDRLDGLRFLDVGCGSGLFSLAAARLGAVVRSFDFDPASVACTREMKRRFGTGDDVDWTIEEGSALDEKFMSSLGEFDIVYSWGVLHHTGEMNRALSNVAVPVRSGGLLYIAIYNDQGWRSKAWLAIKRLYCRSRWGRLAVLAGALPTFFLIAVMSGIRRNGRPWSRFVEYRRERGMSIYHDWVDWLGGLPFEYASVEAITTRFEDLGFKTRLTVPTRSWGCNEFVFQYSD